MNEEEEVLQAVNECEWRPDDEEFTARASAQQAIEKARKAGELVRPEPPTPLLPVIAPGDREARFIAAIVIDGTLDRLNQCRALQPVAFETYRHREIWKRMVKAKTRDEVEAIGMAYVTAGDGDSLHWLQDRQSLYFHALEIMGFDRVDEWRKTLPTEINPDALRQRLIDRRFNFSTPPVEPVPRFLINGKPVCTPGNLTNIIAQAKAGKSAFMGGVVSAAVCAHYQITGKDTLGVTSSPPDGRILIYLDTEQSPFDHDRHMRRALRRAGWDDTEAPAWLFSYALAGFSAPDLRSVLLDVLADGEKEGGIHGLIIDGAADLVTDVNDADESNAFVAELHGLAIKYDCPILSVIHENPGADSGKMRGHLGSQLERKAESNLRLRKADEVTVVFSEKQRGAPILEKDGPRFTWSDDAGMHVSTASKVTLREAEIEADLIQLAEEVFCGNRLRYAEVCKKIEDARRVGQKAGEKWFTRMKKASVIKDVGMGYWERKAP
jgi:hypothetical protein